MNPSTSNPRGTYSARCAAAAAAVADVMWKVPLIRLLRITTLAVRLPRGRTNRYIVEAIRRLSWKQNAVTNPHSSDYALTPAGMQQDVEEPERGIDQWGCKSLVLSLLCFGQAACGTLGGMDTLEALLPPP